MSAPNPPVRSMTAWMRRSGVVKSARLSVWSAPKFARQLQARRDAVEHDHPVGAHVARHRDGIQAESAGALDHSGVTLPKSRAREAVEHLGESAIGRRGDVVGDLIGNAEHRGPWPKVVVVTVRVVEVGWRAGHAVRAALPRAAAQLAPEADGTATTREEINERDSVTLTQRLTGGVKRDARAEALDLAAHLVTKRQIAGQGTVYFLHLAAPDVQIGPADTGARELDQDRAGLGVRHRIFAQLELAAVRLEHRDTSLHVRAPSFPR